MQKSVSIGYTTISARNHMARTIGHSTTPTTMAHAQCRLGIAAYWFEIFAMVPESKFHKPPTTLSVSTKPYDCGQQARRHQRIQPEPDTAPGPVVKRQRVAQRG